VPGPRILAAGAAIAPHGGHGDVHGQRREVVLALRSPAVCSGADDCRRAVREMVMAGADLVKVSVTGGVMSDTDAGLVQQFSDAEIAAIVDSAHRLGRKVTAHAHGADGINSFLKAGGDSIEHGTFMDDTGIRMLKESGRYLIPTLLVGDLITRMASAADSEFSPAQKAKALRVGPRMLDTARRAHRAGVRIAFGTDVVGTSAENANAREFILLTEAGMSPLQAIQAATVNAADHLGIAAVAGSLLPGHSADIVAVDGDPLRDITLLQNLCFVMKAGEVIRQ
jgi:imidazolonepropionase-like amidohydrolase